MINKIIKLLIIVIISTSFMGCQDKNIENYNNISQKHRESVEKSFAELNNAIANYNNKEYVKAKQNAQQCQKLFAETKNISEEAKNIAQTLKSKEWLVDYKNYSIQSEELRIKQCQLLYNLCISTENKENEKSQKIIDEIAIINDQYNKIQITLEDIKAQHPDTFKK